MKETVLFVFKKVLAFWFCYNILLLLLLGGGFIIQGAMEELLCRGFLFHTLKSKVSMPAAIAISTMMFIIPHGSSLFAGEMIYGMIGIVNLTLISLIFSLLTSPQKLVYCYGLFCAILDAGCRR